MNRWMWWRLLARSVLCLSATVFAQPVRADFIAGRYTVDGTGVDQPGFKLNNGRLSAPDVLSGKSVDDLSIDVTPFNPPGNTTVDLGPTFVISTTDPLQFVKFNIVAGSSNLTPEGPGTGMITTILQLDPLSPGILTFDQNAFSTSLLTLNYHGIDIVGPPIDGVASWGAGAFVDFDFHAVPEPSALTLALVGGLALVGIGRLRHRKKLPRA
jgi:hypothetical protein